MKIEIIKGKRHSILETKLIEEHCKIADALGCSPDYDLVKFATIIKKQLLDLRKKQYKRGL